MKAANSETILVVESDRALCELIAIILCRVGYDVLTATNAREAVKIARTSPSIDVLMTEIELGDERGDDLAMRIGALQPDAAVVLISHTSGTIRADAPFKCLAKPFTIAGLRETVRGALNERAARGEFSWAA
jgi:DNA-binding NtrC family response regulator